MWTGPLIRVRRETRSDCSSTVWGDARRDRRQRRRTDGRRPAETRLSGPANDGPSLPGLRTGCQLGRSRLKGHVVGENAVPGVDRDHSASTPRARASGILIAGQSDLGDRADAADLRSSGGTVKPVRSMALPGAPPLGSVPLIAWFAIPDAMERLTGVFPSTIDLTVHMVTQSA